MIKPYVLYRIGGYWNFRDHTTTLKDLFPNSDDDAIHSIYQDILEYWDTPDMHSTISMRDDSFTPPRIICFTLEDKYVSPEFLKQFQALDD